MGQVAETLKVATKEASESLSLSEDQDLEEEFHHDF